MANLIQFTPPAAVETQVYSFPMGYAGGINISESADLIAQNQSPDMQNMNYDAGGVPTKRFGFDAVNAAAWGAQPLRGLWEYELPNGTLKLLAAWNGKLWDVAADGTKTDLCTGAKASIADAQVDGFVFNDKFYFITGTEYLYYDGTNPVALVTTAAYVPTVYMGRTPTGGGTITEAYNLLRDSWKDSISGTAGTTEYFLSLTDVDSVDYVWLSGVLKTVATDYTVDLTLGKVTFGVAPGAGTNNVVIQATKAGIKDATIITKCTFHAIYGGQNDTRVFFSGNPDYKNFRFQSDLMDCTYFPDDGDQEIPESSTQAVTGMGKMGNYLITLTEHQRFWTDVTESGTTVVFTINPLNDQYGCTSWRTVLLAQDGLLSLSRQGVTWTSASTVRSQLGTRMISKSINRGVGDIQGLLSATNAEMEAAYAYIWRNKYYLHVGDTTWVLDLDYSVLSQGIYCWYPYNGLYATLTQFTERQDGLLWAGDNAGTVYKSNIAWSDAGAAVDCWWTSPILFGDRSMIKKFERLNISFGGQAKADHILTVITDEGSEDTNIFMQDTRSFQYGIIDYGNWTYGCVFYPSSQAEKIGYKGEYIQWRIRNNVLGENLVILAQTLIYHAVKRVK